MNGQGPRPDSPRGAVNSKGGGVEAGVRTAILLKEYSCGGEKKLLFSESANASPLPPTNVCRGSRGGSRAGPQIEGSGRSESGGGLNWIKRSVGGGIWPGGRGKRRDYCPDYEVALS